MIVYKKTKKYIQMKEEQKEDKMHGVKGKYTKENHFKNRIKEHMRKKGKLHIKRLYNKTVISRPKNMRKE